MREYIFSAVAVAISAAAAPAVAAPVFADAVVETIVGSGDRGPDGATDPNVSAIGAPDGVFYSPGIGGLLVLSFPTVSVTSSTASLFEITFVCDDQGGDGCANFPEAAEIFAGSGWITGGADVDDALALNAGSFSSVGLVFNNEAQDGFVSAMIDSGFDQLAIVDRSTENGQVENVNAGFDIDAVGVVPVPVPASLPLLAFAVAGVAYLGRRRAAA